MAEEQAEMSRGRWRRMYCRGLLDGRRINAVSVDAASVFWHAYAVADDLGRFPAGPRTFRRKALGMRDDVRPGEPITDEWVESGLRELAQPAHHRDSPETDLTPLIRLYTVKGELFGEITDFVALNPLPRDAVGHRRRAFYINCPPPPDEDDGASDAQDAQDAQSCARVRRYSDSDRGIDLDSSSGAKVKVKPVVVIEQQPRQAGKSKRAGSSPSSSPEVKPVSRPVAWLRWHQAVDPLFGRAGDTKHPKGSPQRVADETTARRWFEDWWPDDGQSNNAAIDRAVKFAGQARRKKKPMAWLTDKLKRESLIGNGEAGR
ncbi:MAG: hypothetical protein COA96_16870 [SAR86 cluster bacterium]|uniref:Uncharacterized protein n=1 Tax=SAR86 cluster bacterium TaxID=2030880 RepID=A0A2A5AGS6_9GAMM|nr:MAG: hypothetical protein COA96_16870 [SAR86 cluster bacterium]